MKRRAICLITVLALCLSLCPVRVLAADYTADPGPSTRMALDGNKTGTATYDVTDSLMFDTDGHSYTVSGQTAVSVKSTGRLYLTTGKFESTGGAGIEVLSGGFLRIDQAGMTVIGTTYGLDISSGATAKLSGGTYTGGTAAIRAEDYGALLVSGFAYFNESGETLLPDSVAGLKTVTVKECTNHIYNSYTPAAGAPSHSWICLACRTEGTELCTFDFDENSSAGCNSGCGNTLEIAVTPTSEVYDGELKPENLSVTFKLNGDEITLSEGTDYTVEYTPLAGAGKTLVRVTGEDAFNGTFTQEYSVVRARPEIIWGDDKTSPVTVDYDGDPVDELPEVEITPATDDDLEELQSLLYFSYKRTHDGNGVAVNSAEITGSLPTDAGTYEIKAVLPETANYQGAESDPITLKIRKISPFEKDTDVPKANTLTYDGTAHKLVTGGTLDSRAVGAKILFALGDENNVNDSDFSEAIPTAIDAGTYYVWYKVEGTDNYDGFGPEMIKVTIQRKEITPIVELEYSTTVYDGGFKEPKVTVRDPDTREVLPDSEYKVTYWNNQYVGKALVIVSDEDDGNYVIMSTPEDEQEVKPPEEAPDGFIVTFDITPKDQDALTITGQKSTVTYGDVFVLGTVGGSGNGTVKWEIVPCKDAGEEEDGSEETTDPAKIAVIDEDSGEVTVTGVGKVTVRATKSGTNNDGNHYDATAEWTFTAVPKRVTAKVTAKSKTYDGDDDTTVHAEIEQSDLAFTTDVITITRKINTEQIDTDLTGTFDDEKAGTNKTVTVDTENAVITLITLNGNETITNKSGATGEKYIVTIPGTATADIYKAEIKVTAPTPKTPTLTYSGSGQDLVSGGIVSVGVLEDTPPSMEYSRYENGPWSTTIPTGTNAGDYEVWYRVKESANYLGTAADSIVVTIVPKSVSPSVTLPSENEFNYVYDGTEKKPAVTVKYTENGGTTEIPIPASEYTVTYSDNVNVGNAVVKVTAKEGGNYSFTERTIGFTITTGDSAVLTSSPQAVPNLEYNGQPQNLVTVGTASGGYLVYAWKEGNGVPTETDYVKTIPQGTNAGEYKVYYKVKGDGNHADTEPEYLFVIIRPKTVTDPVIELTLPDGGYTYDNNEKKPSVTVKDGNDVIPGPGNTDGKPSEYTVSYSNNRNAGTATVHINDVTGGNYDVSGSTTFEIRKAKAEFSTKPVGASGLVYNGKAQPLLTTVGVAGVPEGGTVVYSLDGGEYSTAIPTAASRGQHTILAKVRGDAKNYEDSEEISLKVLIAQNTYSPTVELSSTTFRYNGSERKPTVTVKDRDGNVIAADEYTVTYEGDTVNVTYDANKKEIIGYTIKITSKGNNYSFDEQTCTVLITPAEQAAISITGTRAEVIYGDKIQLGITGGTGDGTVTWDVKSDKSSGDAISSHITISTGGLLTVNTISEEGETFTVTATRTSTSGNYKEATATWTFTVGPSTSTPNTPPEPVAPVEPGAPDETAPSIQTVERDGTASTVVNGAAGDELVEEAVANQSKNVVIRPEITGDVTRTEVSLPASTVSRLSSETDAALTVSTPVADVIIPNASLETLSGAGGSIGVVTERVENTVTLTLTADGQELEDIPGGLTLTVPMEDAGPGTVAVVIHEDGTRETVRWSVATDGAVRIPLNGSVTVELVDNSKDFADVPSGSWAAGAVAFASAHEIFSGTGEASFSPNLTMSRAMLATMLYILEGRPEQELTNGFSDVSSDAWYAAGVSWAEANGIVSGDGSGRFDPNEGISREQLAVMFWKYAGSPTVEEQALPFLDADQASGYAMDALRWAAASGLMCGDGAGHLNPAGLTTRAQAAQLLKNYMESI